MFFIEAFIPVSANTLTIMIRSWTNARNQGSPQLYLIYFWSSLILFIYVSNDPKVVFAFYTLVARVVNFKSCFFFYSFMAFVIVTRSVRSFFILVISSWVIFISSIGLFWRGWFIGIVFILLFSYPYPTLSLSNSVLL